MPISVSQLADDIRPRSTVLFFGSGASIPSGAPSSQKVVEALGEEFRLDLSRFTLSEASGLVEHKSKDRRRMINVVRSSLSSVRPTGGILNIPLYDWKSIYTTNYDNLIESAYGKAGKDISVYSSNFDFTADTPPNATKLFKVHGTIEQDISSGHNARLIITENDYESAEDYREFLFDRLKSDLAGSRLIIVGHSLADPDIKALVTRAIAINAKALAAGRITLMMYESDADRAAIFEAKGLQVAFGGVDEFFAALSKAQPEYVLVHQDSADPLAGCPALQPVTLDVTHAVESGHPDVSAMFNGWPASHADIAAGLTFSRSTAEAVTSYLQSGDEAKIAVVLGASGVGKTTAVRQSLQQLKAAGVRCWEHNGDHLLMPEHWLKVADDLAKVGLVGAIFVDDAHIHLSQINDIIDGLAAKKLPSLKVICASSRNSWRPRVKSPNLFRYGRDFRMSKLNITEVDRLLQLVDNHAEIRLLVENSFSGFSRHERQRRLVERCESDMFVCLKNIFASEKFDDIILREYAGLQGHLQEIYKLISALESAGVRVHRQLVIRLLGIPPVHIESILTELTDIISEYVINEREGVFGWKGRHPVITGIVAKYKFSDPDKLIDLFEKVIDAISPTYQIEMRSMRDLCTVQQGISRFADRRIQNRLLRRMMSAAPGERVPRHRLIRNLIEMGEYDQADTEMRIFDKDFGRDGPVARYRIDLMAARATRAPGIMTEDRITILTEAADMAVVAARRYQNNVQIMSAYCTVGIEIYRLTGKLDVFDAAIRTFREAEARVGDPEFGRVAARFEQRIAGHSVSLGEVPILDRP